jgi:hypothetical protein
LYSVDVLVGVCPDLDGLKFSIGRQLPKELRAADASNLLRGLILPCFEVAEVKGKLVHPVSEPSLDCNDAVVVMEDLEGLSAAASEGRGPH